MKHSIYRLIVITTLTILLASCFGSSDSDEDGDTNNTDGDTDSDNSATDGDKDITDGDDSTTDGDNDTIDGDDDRVNTGNGTGEDLLASLDSLGIDTSESTAKDPDGNELPEGWNPLGRTINNLSTISELWVMGAAKDNKTAWLVDDGLKNYDQLYQDQDDSWAGTTAKTGIGADIDGNGIQDIVNVYFVSSSSQLKMRILKSEDNTYSIVNNEIALSVGGSNAIRVLDIVAGEFDGDASDEIAIVATSATEGQADTIFTSYIWILDDENSNFATLFQDTFEDTSNIRVDAGNIDIDTQEEIGIAYGGTNSIGKYTIYDDAKNEFENIKQDYISIETDSGQINICYTDVVFGDIDNDGMSEIVFAGDNVNINTMQTGILVLDDAANSYKRLYEYGVNGGTLFDMYPVANLADVNGNGKLDLIVNDMILFLEWNEGELLTEDTKLETCFTSWESAEKNFWQNSSIAVGDFTGDGLSDIAIVTPKKDLQIFGMNLSGEFGLLKKFDGVKAGNGFPSLVAVNTDKDSTIVRYTGEHKYIITEPIILATLAAAPCQSSWGQEGCSTTFGESSSEDHSVGGAVSISAGIIFGTKFKAPWISQSEFELEMSLSAEITASYQHTWTRTKSVTYSIEGENDGVIFAAVPYDVYIYEILSTENGENIGETTSILIPRDPYTAITSLKYYNDNLYDSTYSLGSSVFTHTPGDVSSYKRTSEAQSILQQKGGLKTDKVTVGEGEGSTEVGVEIAEANSVGGSLAINFEAEIKTTVTSCTIGASFGISAEANYSYTNTKASQYGGSVSHMSSEFYGTNNYSFGLFTYKTSHEASGQQFHVIDYWVEE